MELPPYDIGDCLDLHLSDLGYIDVHAHPCSCRRNGRPLIDEFAARFRKLGIEKCNLLGQVTLHGRRPRWEQVRAINDKTIQWVQERSDAYIGMCFLNPNNGSTFNLAEISRTIEEGPLVGIKLEMSRNARDQRLDHILQRTAELEIPILHHAWSYAFPARQRLDPEESDPADIAILAERFPQVTIIMAHLTGIQHRGVAEIRHLPNVVVDTSSGQPEYGLVEYATRQLGASRVLFGSDESSRDLPVQLGRSLAPKSATGTGNEC